MKGEHGPSNGAVSPPLASPTSATSPSVARHNRFDPYGKSMRASFFLDFSTIAAQLRPLDRE